MENLQYFIALLAVFVIGLILIKKITGCMFRIVVTLAILAFAYWALTGSHVL